MNERIELTDDELLERIVSSLAAERAGLAALIGYLSEVEERRLHLAAAYSSMFEFCTKRLGLSEGESFRRLTAARLVRRFPAILELVERGSIHLSALVRLRDHLTDENHSELLREASGKGKQELERLLAARNPQPDAPSKIRRLPTPRERKPSTPLTLSLPAAEAPRPPASPPAPLSANRYKVQFTTDQVLKDKLERALDLLSHANPGRDLAVVVERGIDLLLADLEKKKLGRAKRPRAERKNRPGAISRAVRREVFARDGERCTYVSEEGRRCEAKAFAELDHIEPRARGGSAESDNLRVLCRAHNRLEAERAFGKEHVARRIHFRQRKYRETDDQYDKLLGALTGLGFRPKPTRAVLDRMRSGKSRVAWSAPLNQLLREAAQLLTA
jgi:hypothetical protein